MSADGFAPTMYLSRGKRVQAVKNSIPLLFLAAPGEVLVVLAVQRNRRMHQFFPTASLLFERAAASRIGSR